MKGRSSFWIALAFTFAVVAWMASGWIGGTPPPPAEAAAGADAREPFSVRVRSVRPEPVLRELVAMGQTLPARRVEVRVEVAGRVLEIGAARGTHVAADELLLRLDPDDRPARLKQAEALLAQRSIEAYAARTLGAQGFSAEVRVAEAEAQLAQATAARDLAALELRRTEIRAPFEGVLEDRGVEIGDYVEPGDVVAVVIEQDPFLVAADVPEAQISRLRAGMPGSAVLIDGSTVEGRLRYVSSEAFADTRSFRIELEVPNPDGRFVANATAELRVPLGTVSAHRLPSSLLTLDEDGRIGVMAVGPDERVVFHPARIVRSDPASVWIADLPEELDVITVGQGFVRKGDPVRPVPEAPAVAEAAS